MLERRALARHKTFIKGRIYFNNRLSSLDCIVRDVTSQGARLEVSENVPLPDSFEIYLPNKDEYFHARVEWRKGGNIGVSWSAEQAGKQWSESGSVVYRAGDPLADRVAKLEHDVALLQKRLDALQGV